ncbi:SDR family oxidoreductase [Aequorivita viscosa]|uniref:3-oxoacyl-[acyl-carrier protein] reductase n=1 Tax=Aequorivita viscosa TaxID=797419 RepID=A0A1M6F6D7_9FLAO|nr:SDR family oxidoreductase [Aequorivita viscosa]SDW65494.1 3-oxoacyl-[acyl-carrier protein] reductase [Aequorivita viscosa]SHI93288.1 3-oxoacyl-[acyl-carrier protein] reductase [Aequorivita viscosa]
MNLDLTNKNALVCGSTAGIGKATAILLARLGATITLFARDESKLKETLIELPHEKGQKHNYYVADFTNPQQVKEKVNVAASNKTIHILINNTGGPKGGPIFSAATEEFEKAFSMHVICNQILVQAVVPGMKNADYGRIINIISTSVKQPIDNLGVSNTIRGAVASWSKTLANELGQYGITVNNVLPGFTATDRLEDIVGNAAKRTNKTEQEASEFMKNLVPAKRFAQPGEIASAVAFLASEAASYINGVNLPVDGGRTKSL